MCSCGWYPNLGRKRPCWQSSHKWTRPPKPSRPLSPPRSSRARWSFLDRITIKCVEDYAQVGLPLDAEAILLMETDGHPVVVEEEEQQMAEIARNHGARAVQLAHSAEEAIQFTTARRVAFRRWRACHPPPSWKTPQCHAVNWLK